MMVSGLVPTPPRGLVAYFVLIPFSLLFLFVYGGRLPFGALDAGYSNIQFGGTFLKDVLFVRDKEVGQARRANIRHSIIFPRGIELQLSETVRAFSLTTSSSQKPQTESSKASPTFVASETPAVTSTARSSTSESPSISPSITSTPASPSLESPTTGIPADTQPSSSSDAAQRSSTPVLLGHGPPPKVAAEPPDTDVPKNRPHGPPKNPGKGDDPPGKPAPGSATTTTTSPAVVDTGTGTSADSTPPSSTSSPTSVSVSETSTVASVADGDGSPPPLTTSQPAAAASPTGGAGSAAATTNNVGQPANGAVLPTSPPSTSTAAQGAQSTLPPTTSLSSSFQIAPIIIASLSYSTSCPPSSTSNPSNAGAPEQTPPINVSENTAVKRRHSDLAIVLGVLVPILTLAGLVLAFILLRRRISRANKARDIEEIRTEFSPPLVNPFEVQDIRGAASSSNNFRDIYSERPYSTDRQGAYTPDHFEPAIIIYPIEEESARELESRSGTPVRDGDADSASEDGERQHDHRSSRYSNSDSSWIWYRPPMAV